MNTHPLSTRTFFPSGWLALACLLAPSLAQAKQPDGNYELTGSDSRGRATRVQLQIQSHLGSLRVTRKASGPECSEASHEHLPAEWNSSSAKLRGGALLVTYAIERALPDERSIITRLENDQPLGEILDLPPVTYQAIYRFKDDAIREVVWTEATEGSDPACWRYASTRGERLLNARERDEVMWNGVQAWYARHTQERYQVAKRLEGTPGVDKYQLAIDRALTARGAHRGTEPDPHLEALLDQRYAATPYRDAQGRPVPRSRLVLYRMKFEGLTTAWIFAKSFVFDGRTGELLDEGVDPRLPGE